MYQKFTVSQVFVDEAENNIKVTFTYDVDEDTVDDSSIYITEAETEKQRIIETNKTVEQSTVTLYYGDLELNKTYQIVAKKDIKSIMGDELDIEYTKTFILHSDVDSTITIISPSQHEEVTSLNVKLEESVGKNKKLFNRYRIQIAGDHGFLKVFSETVTEKKEIKLSVQKDSPQYFIRARAEKDDKHYGNWSDKVSFIVIKDNSEKDNDNPDKDDDDYVFEDDFEVVGYPENGTTPFSFIIEFDEDIDPDSIHIEDIILTRKKV